nr:Dot/Icm secretion system protein IcmQ [Legionellales bacterium]
MPQSDEIVRSKLLLESLDKAIKEGPWARSTYLANLGKKLKEHHYRIHQALTELEALEHPLKSQGGGGLAQRIAQRAGQTQVFIALYNTDGTNLAKWEKLLMGLRTLSVSRPIYANEDDMRALVRSKPNKQNEAYAVAFIDSDKIIAMEEEVLPRDKLGHALLTLKDGAITPQQVVRFMHVSGHYLYKNNKLVRQGDIEYIDFR